MNLTLTDSQQVVLRVTPQDKRGNPTTEPAPPTWDTSDATILAITPADDGLSCVAVAAGPLGNCQITATDAESNTAIFNISVIAGAAVSLGGTADAPVEQP